MKNLSFLLIISKTINTSFGLLKKMLLSLTRCLDKNIPYVCVCAFCKKQQLSTALNDIRTFKLFWYQIKNVNYYFLLCDSSASGRLHCCYVYSILLHVSLIICSLGFQGNPYLKNLSQMSTHIFWHSLTHCSPYPCLFHIVTCEQVINIK